MDRREGTTNDRACRSTAQRAVILQRPLTAEEVARTREDAVARLSQRVTIERAREAFARNFDPAILPQLRPAIGGVLIDSEQRVWVERFEPEQLGSEFQTTGNRWSVVADGQPLAQLLLPPHTRLEAVRGDRVAVLQRDSMDVQIVRIYTVRRP